MRTKFVNYFNFVYQASNVVVLKDTKIESKDRQIVSAYKI